ncbi:hypothetical protein [Streptomyces longispororuber]|uniref:hypothetical protein n=1 Tax=Streptomyces longispororuber TaxID=68230 RepID=UPI00210B0491|nr:hypothetical protein [Streptomyces longispororuber]MCQ4214257.1 hypothetical protein [Streptomyces longispororuber]
MNTFTWVILSGAVGGAGVALLVNEVLPAAPKLRPALDRLNPAPAPPRQPSTETSSAQAQAQAQLGAWLVRRLPVRLPRKDLDLLGQSAEAFLLNKALLVLLGLFAPSLFTAAWTLLGIGVPLYAPAVVGLILAALFWFVPDLMIRRDAATARAECAHAIAVYLELVALRLAAGIAIESALEQAAQVGRGWVFLRIRDALLRARIERTAQWAALKNLGARLDVPVLADVADFVQMSAQEGASVYDTVRHRAASLRTEQLTTEAAAANADTEKMQAPLAVLCVLIMAALAFPALLNAFHQSS